MGTRTDRLKSLLRSRVQPPAGLDSDPTEPFPPSPFQPLVHLENLDVPLPPPPTTLLPETPPLSPPPSTFLPETETPKTPTTSSESDLIKQIRGLGETSEEVKQLRREAQQYEITPEQLESLDRTRMLATLGEGFMGAMGAIGRTDPSGAQQLVRRAPEAAASRLELQQKLAERRRSKAKEIEEEALKTGKLGLEKEELIRKLQEKSAPLSEYEKSVYRKAAEARGMTLPEGQLTRGHEASLQKALSLTPAIKPKEPVFKTEYHTIPEGDKKVTYETITQDGKVISRKSVAQGSEPKEKVKDLKPYVVNYRGQPTQTVFDGRQYLNLKGEPLDTDGIMPYNEATARQAAEDTAVSKEQMKNLQEKKKKLKDLMTKFNFKWSVGPVAGRLTELIDKTELNNRDRANFFSMLSGDQNKVVHELFGATFTPAEQERVRQQLPDRLDPAEVYVDKLNNMFSEAEKIIREKQVKGEALQYGAEPSPSPKKQTTKPDIPVWKP